MAARAHVLTVTFDPDDNHKHPYIYIGGKWLADCCFEIGDRVLDEGRNGNILIRAIQFIEQEE